MKRFDTFGAYMFDLLFAPLKRGKRAANQFFIFFKVIGRIFDGMKKDAFRLRDELNVATASPVMLPVHGQDRDMPRLEGESVENYRARLSMKGIISEWGGTKSGILYALTSLGYEQSTIEPFSYQDPERWAEFIVFLKGSKQSGVNNLAVIDAEVRKVKEGFIRETIGHGDLAARVLGVLVAVPEIHPFFRTVRHRELTHDAVFLEVLEIRMIGLEVVPEGLILSHIAVEIARQVNLRGFRGGNRSGDESGAQTGGQRQKLRLLGHI